MRLSMDFAMQICLMIRDLMTICSFWDWQSREVLQVTHVVIYPRSYLRWLRGWDLKCIYFYGNFCVQRSTCWSVSMLFNKRRKPWSTHFCLFVQIQASSGWQFSLVKLALRRLENRICSKCFIRKKDRLNGFRKAVRKITCFSSSIVIQASIWLKYRTRPLYSSLLTFPNLKTWDPQSTMFPRRVPLPNKHEKRIN